ncbi:MAG TPA: peptidylprolyl isomerase [Caulobacteraceae bacterium]|jgi:hypothetical protein|nr:peptidylprolyl isomerase [Caulobacteraceae bacterium]
MMSAKTVLERSRVSLLMAAGGAVLGLVLAGASLFSTRAPSTWTVPPEDAATVNGRPILQSDFTAQTEMELGVPFNKATPEQRRQILDEMIREELFVQRGLELNEQAVDPAIRNAIVLSVQQQVAVDATAETPTEARLRAFYDSHKAKYESVGEMTLHDLVPAPGAPARMAEAAEALKAGTPLALVKPAYGLTDSGKLDGTELYFAAELHIGRPLFQIAARLSDGQVAGPVTVAGAPHLLVMEHNKRPVAERYEDARDEVYHDYKEALETRLRDGEYRFLRSRSTVMIAPQNR